MTKLRSMSASFETVPAIVVEVASTGEVIELTNAVVLTSYASRVAVFGNGTVYLLPRYDYSNTTWKHVHAFVQDCTSVCDMCAADIRKTASTPDTCYQFASSWASRAGGNWWAY